MKEKKQWKLLEAEQKPEKMELILRKLPNSRNYKKPGKRKLEGNLEKKANER